MTPFRLPSLLAMLVSALMSSVALAADKTGLAETMSHDGLQKVQVKGLELAYARPGASLAGYQRIQLDPVQVSFSKHWNPNRTGSAFKLSTEERENIRNGVARIVHDEFLRELQGKSRYQVANEAGPDVLRVKVSIIDLYVNAPDTLTAGRSRTYTVSAGSMTLFAELFDAETGEVLARVVDRREARNTLGMTLSSSQVNRAEAADIAAAWARILRNALDSAHGIGKP